MTRTNYLILLFLILVSCNKKDQNIYSMPVKNFNIEMLIEKNHLFLREYKRHLIISSKDNEELKSLRLKDDNGTGANSYLFEDEKNYIVIDCDGSWYFIDKKTGKINLTENFWMKSPPKNYLGTFLLTSTSNKIIFVKEKNIKSEDIYKYGGG